MDVDTNSVRLMLNGRWEFEELFETSRDYIQLYAFAHSLLEDLPAGRRSEIDFIYSKFPWRGGFSTVNFFYQLFRKVPAHLRPKIKRIEYASPGFIELGELLVVALAIARMVKSICGSLSSAHDLYRSIQKGMTDHQLTQIDIKRRELELTAAQIEFSKNSADELVKQFGLSREQEHLLDMRVQNNQVMKVKILLSVFRRIEPLAKKQNDGKLLVSTDSHRE